MSRVNTKRVSDPIYTHEGARARKVDVEAQLLRSVMSCLLWENEFYEDGVEIAKRISTLAEKVDPQALAAIAVRARNQFKLRHVPLHLLVTLAKTGSGTPILGNTIPHVVRRADELAELLALYWKANGADKPLSKQLKVGLARAVQNFNEYSLAKYDRDSDVRLRDVIFLTHAKPKDKDQAKIFAKLVNKSFFPTATKGGFKVKSGLHLKGEPGLATPDTWETELSAGKDKKATFERLLSEGKLGYLALLRNLRNMVDAGVDRSLIVEALRSRKGAQWVLPFRYVAAARHAPSLVRAIDEALLASIDEMPRLSGHTVVMVDVSGSMAHKLSGKSDLTRMDAAAALGAMFPGDVSVFSFSNSLIEVPAHRGLAGVDAITKSQPHSGTQLIQAVRHVNDRVKFDRLIVISDEQAAHDRTGLPKINGAAYMINVASAKNGIGYGSDWTHVDGFSEAIFTYIREYEGQ